ncbi:MAG: amidohydrolase [Bacteroidota bacterium]
MPVRLLLVLLLGVALAPASYAQADLSPAKQAAIASVEAQADVLIALSDSIWSYAELAFQEQRSAEGLADLARANGFRVTMGVAETPTAFVAEYGSGAPIIGILGEFDALPGLSQQTVPTKTPRVEGGSGHGCGHNLFGVGSLGAAIAVKDLIEDGTLQGTIRFYGTPAEERFFGKLWMIRAGLFDDVDVMMDWHPSAETKAAVQSSLALVDFVVEFRGATSHASADPWRGRSATDALELYTTGINYLREHVEPSVRMHYHIQEAGEAVNIVPDYARIWTRIRDNKRAGMQAVWDRVERIAEGAALMTDTEHTITLVSGIHEIVVNRTGGARLQANLDALGELTYTEEEQAFARTLQAELGQPPVGMAAPLTPLEVTLVNPGGGSTDAGDVSFVVPTIRLAGAVAPAGTPWHSWAVVAYSGMSIGHKGMVYSAKAMAMTMVDLFQDEALRDAVKAEHAERVGDYEYNGIVPAGPPPLNTRF